MFCATLVCTGQCALACSGNPDEFQTAWNIRWNNGAQAIVEDYGPVSRLRRVNGDVVWAVEAEARRLRAGCTDVGFCGGCEGIRRQGTGV